MTLEDLIDEAEWTRTHYISAHEYVIAKDEPSLHAAMKVLVEEDGYPGQFLKTVYRYVDVGEYRYWVMGVVLNRSRLDVEGVTRLGGLDGE